ncbi:MAG: hypothetical protein LBG72_01250 [Spirochaetaceae bacterium]|jgi:hypothetical protein|nr:hypothetical protein [Spirochaetaceae bacterium]
MKKIIVLLVLVLGGGGALSVSAQGLYFDIGLGVGWAWTKVNGNDIAKPFVDLGCKEIGVDIGLKAGFGPFGRIPLYIAAEAGGIGHRISYNADFIQLNSYLLGGGIIFYPVSFLQLAADIGYSYTGNSTSLEDRIMYKSKGGFAYNASLAFDLGTGNHGCLFGLRYFAAINTLENGAKQDQAGLSIFVKYAYRHKVKPLAKDESNAD